MGGRRALEEYVTQNIPMRRWGDIDDFGGIAVYLASGRQHQIRRHLAAIGHPLWGDPRYGQGNKNSEGLALQAQMLAFTCPFTHKQRQWRSIPPLWALTQLTPEALEGALSALYQRYQQQPRPPEWGFAPR